MSSKRTLDLVASSVAERDNWVKGINALRKFGAVLNEDQLDEIEDQKRMQRAQDSAAQKIEERKKARQGLKQVTAKHSGIGLS